MGLGIVVSIAELAMVLLQRPGSHSLHEGLVQEDSAIVSVLTVLSW